jgi:phosphatidylglycerol:prolipoprotein diacylglycerol transferase
MSPILFHIYGPISIHSFGLMIAIALTITLYYIHQDKKIREIVTCDELATIFQVGFFSGIIGGRTWFLATHSEFIENWTDFFTVWYGGLSILGAIIGIITSLFIYFYIKKIPAFTILDRLSIYGPLAQSISRFGCFFAGCCYGQPTTLPWAITYTNQHSLAPLHIALHPTQIYSAINMFAIFILLFYFNTYWHKYPGQTIGLYLMCMSVERFCIDFIRGDQEFFATTPVFLQPLTAQQLLSLIIFFVGCVIFFQSNIQTFLKKRVS